MLTRDSFRFIGASLALFLFLECGAVAQPSKSEIREQLQNRMPACVSISSLDIKASENIGSKTAPNWQFRFVAKGIIKEDTYVEGNVFLNVKTVVHYPPNIKSADIFGTASATLSREKWAISFSFEDNVFLSDHIYSRLIPKSKLSGSDVIVGTNAEKELIEKALRALADGNTPNQMAMAKTLYYDKKEPRAKPFLASCIKEELGDLLDRHFRTDSEANKQEIYGLITELKPLQDLSSVYTLMRAMMTFGLVLRNNIDISTVAQDALRSIGPQAIPVIESNWKDLLAWLSSPEYLSYAAKNRKYVSVEIIKERIENEARTMGRNINLPIDSGAGRIVEENHSFTLSGRDNHSKIIEFYITTPGHISIEAIWDESVRKKLHFILYKPGGETRSVRKIRSPATIDEDVTETRIAGGPKWKLTVRIEPITDSANVKLVIKHPR